MIKLKKIYQEWGKEIIMFVLMTIISYTYVGLNIFYSLLMGLLGAMIHYFKKDKKKKRDYKDIIKKKTKLKR
jgi:Ca2+-dependent lipid-binding protein